jgi:hypothetical protein
MKLRITVHMSPESKEELEELYVGQVKEVRGHFDELHKEGILGPPERVQLRYVMDGGRAIAAS